MVDLFVAAGELFVFLSQHVSEVEYLVGLFFHQFREVLYLKVCPFQLA